MAAIQVYATQICLSYYQKSNCKDVDDRKSSFIGPHPVNQNTWYLRRWKKYGKPHPWKRSGGGREGWGGYRAIRGYNISMLAGACPARLVSRCHLCQTTMRVKTVPRQRVIQDNRNIESLSETSSVKSESTRRSSNDDEKDMSEAGKDGLQVSNEDAIDSNENQMKSKDRSKSAAKEKDKETLKYSEEVLDMSIKLKAETSAEGDSVLLSLIAGPSCKYSNSQSKEDVKESLSRDDNNNMILPNTDPETPSAAGSSSIEDSGTCENELTTHTINDSDKPSEALNLCKRDCQDEDDSNHGVGSDERLKDTFLYKIMTDPTFLENIQKHKQTKRYACPYCKQEFNNSDEQADHMDAKKDESNQVVCCACKKTFAQKRYLRYHQRCHSERTMFTCDICTKKYTRIDNLSRHNAFHVNPDKFSCNCCEKTFARKDLLNKHLKCHDNKYRFFCEICQRYFKGPLSLENHKKNFHSKTA